MIEEHYRYPQDIEWAFEKGRLYILQTRRAKVGGA
jgi:phosphoenolpyruvate synthase/pyruvate phosphate dikinase